MNIATERVTEQTSQATRAYPAPPSLDWAVLCMVQVLVICAAVAVLPRAWWALVATLAANAWIVYLCVWVRRLNPAFLSLIWCGACVALQLAFTVPGMPVLSPATVSPATMTASISAMAISLLLLAILLWLVTIFVLRAELHFHYNHVEPVGLYLNPGMTLLFSYFYFQFHLRRIAQLKQHSAD